MKPNITKSSLYEHVARIGKAMASRILPAFADPSLASGFDASTQGLLAYCRGQV